MSSKQKIFNLPYDKQIEQLYEEVSNYDSKKEVNKRRRKRIVDVFLDSVLLVCLVTLLTFIVFVFVNKYNNKVTMFFSYSVQYVHTDSMAPTIPEGSIFVGREVKDDTVIKVGEKDSANPGDIITFYDNYGNLVTHRAVYTYVDTKGVTQFETKGDNNKNIDPFPVSRDKIVTVFLRRIF